MVPPVLPQKKKEGKCARLGPQMTATSVCSNAPRAAVIYDPNIVPHHGLHHVPHHDQPNRVYRCYHCS